MVAKALLVFCAQALFIQSITAQIAYGYPSAPYASAARSLAASNGPGLLVTSASPISPTGVSVTSENIIEGALAVGGAVPFLGTVGLEGVLPTGGAGAVSYNCGDGAVAVTAEEAGPYGAGAYAAGPYAAGAYGLAGAYDYAAGPYGYANAYDYAAGPYGYGAGAYGYGAGPYGYAAGPYAASPFGYGAYGAGPFGYGLGYL